MDDLPGEIPNSLKAFLSSCVDGVEQLDLLVRLFRWGGSWSVQAVSTDLGVPESIARHHLETLRSRGLLQATFGREVSYSCAPRTAELRRYIVELVDFSMSHPTTIRRYLAGGVQRARQPAEAFRERESE